MEAPAKSRLTPLRWSALIAAACALPGLVLSAWSGGLDKDELLHPWLGMLATASMIAVVASPILTIILVVRDRSELSWRRHLALPFAQLGIALGLLALMLAAHFPLFDPTYQGQSVSSPDGRATVFLYSQGLFCGYRLYRQDGASPILHHESSVSVNCRDLPREPRLVWTDGLHILGDNGEEVLDHPIILNLFSH
jgi:hypothetical protein